MVDRIGIGVRTVSRSCLVGWGGVRYMHDDGSEEDEGWSWTGQVLSPRAREGQACAPHATCTAAPPTNPSPASVLDLLLAVRALCMNSSI
jgi:hypothetical protein